MELPYITLLLCCCTCLFACKKGKQENIAKTKLLKAGKWQVIACSASFNYRGTDTTMDAYKEWNSCEQDDYLEFSDKYKGTHNENTDKCPEDNQVEDFKWEVQNSGTELSMSAYENEIKIFEILEITGSQMKLRLKDSYYGEPATYIHTYKNIK
jgi:hypothetical protein